MKTPTLNPDLERCSFVESKCFHSQCTVATRTLFTIRQASACLRNKRIFIAGNSVHMALTSPPY